jgi:hypothetical protein
VQLGDTTRLQEAQSLATITPGGEVFGSDSAKQIVLHGRLHSGPGIANVDIDALCARYHSHVHLPVSR